MKGTGLIFGHEMKKILKEKSILFGFIVLPILALLFTVMLSMAKPASDSVSSYNMYFFGVSVDSISIAQMNEKDIYIVSIDESPEDFMKSENFHDEDVLVDYSDPMDVKIYYHESNDISNYLKSSADSFVRETYSEIYKGFYPKISFRNVITRDIRPKEEVNRVIAMLLPYMLILPLTANIANFAGDTIAGDKERGTFYQALLTPVPPLSLIMGKIFAVSLISLASSAIYISCDVLGSRICEALNVQDAFGFAGVHVPPHQFLLILLYAILLCYLFSNLGVLISLFCKDTSHAQIAQIPVTLLCTMAAMLSMFRFGVSPSVHYLIPVYNVCIIFQDILNARVKTTNMLLVAVSFIVLSVAVLIVTLLSYKSEKVRG